MDLKLLIFLLLVNAFIIYLIARLIDKIYQKKYNSAKNHLSSLLSLNISHLHDASNYFSLLKNQIKDSDSPRAFSKGASYHFRSLFEELKQNKKNLDNLEIDELSNKNTSLLYNKEALDLKDIIQLELLQLSSPIEIKDKSNSEHALINGNFSLLSKAILNLAENAIKYTEKQVKIELSENDNKWQLKISSYGKAIPESLATEINADTAGHGLNSLKEIIDFHNAELAIDTLANEGTSIRLVFKKYNKEENKTKKSNKKAFKLNNQVIIIATIFIIGIGFSLTISRNKEICTNYYEKLYTNNPEDIIGKEKICLEAIDKLNQSIIDEDENFDSIYDEFINKFSKKNQRLVSLLIFEQVLLNAPISFQEKSIAEAKSLVVQFPSSINLNFYLTNHYFEKKKFNRALVFSIKSFLSLIDAKLYIHPKLYTAMQVEEKPEALIQLLAQLYDGEVLFEQELTANGTELEAPERIIPQPIIRKAKPKPKLIESPQPNTDPPPNEEKELERILEKKYIEKHQDDLPIDKNMLDEMIEKQDEELGLDLDL